MELEQLISSLDPNISSRQYVKVLYDHLSKKYQKKTDSFFLEYKDLSRQVFNELKTRKLLLGVKKIIGCDISVEKVKKLEEFFYSIKQSAKSKSGREFEKLISYYLEEEKISFFNQKCYCGKCSDDIVYGDIIIIFDNSHYLLSCKRTLKERWQEIVSEKNKYIKETYCITFDTPSENILKKLEKNNIFNITIGRGFVDFISRRFSKSFKFIDLFCGSGGFSEGMKQSGFVELLGVDNNETCIKTFNKNQNNVGICRDIYFLDEEFLSRYKNIDLVTLSPPCQSFSVGGKRDKDDIRADCLTESIRILKMISPKFFCLENVCGIKTFKNGNGDNLFDNFISEMRNAGYMIIFDTLNSYDFSIPQKRKRLFIVGNKLGINFSFGKEKEYPNVNLKDILIDESRVPEGYYHSQKMIDGFINRAKKNKENGKGFGATFNTIPFDVPSRTLSCRYYKDFAECLIQYSSSRVRGLTEFEASQVQGYPRDYLFHGTKREKYIQIGNSVAVGVSKFLGEKIYGYLSGIHHEQVNESVIEISRKTVEELKQYCRENGIRGFSNKKKPELLELIKNR
jgi:DNA (cytosine-5)-methyltransferase 1